MGMRFKTMAMVIAFIGLASSGYADTIDVWQLKINQEIVFRSNQAQIEFGYPMQIAIGEYGDKDTLKVVYMTDAGIERMKWQLLVEDEEGNILTVLENQPDINYVYCLIAGAKNLMHANGRSKVFLRLNHLEDPSWTRIYDDKYICIVSL